MHVPRFRKPDLGWQGLSMLEDVCGTKQKWKGLSKKLEYLCHNKENHLEEHVHALVMHSYIRDPGARLGPAPSPV